METKELIFKLYEDEDTKETILEVFDHQVVVPKSMEVANENVVFMKKDDVLVAFTTFDDNNNKTQAVALSKLIRDLDVQNIAKTGNVNLGSLEDIAPASMPESWLAELQKYCIDYGESTRVLLRLFQMMDGLYVPLARKKNEAYQRN